MTMNIMKTFSQNLSVRGGGEWVSNRPERQDWRNFCCSLCCCFVSHMFFNLFHGSTFVTRKWICTLWNQKTSRSPLRSNWWSKGMIMSRRSSLSSTLTSQNATRGQGSLQVRETVQDGIHVGWHRGLESFRLKSPLVCCSTNINQHPIQIFIWNGRTPNNFFFSFRKGHRCNSKNIWNCITAFGFQSERRRTCNEWR